MKPSVFISRSADRAAAFIYKVSGHVSDIVTESLIDFKTIKADTIPNTEWLFFYSQTGADHFFQQHNPKDLIALEVKIGAFGEKTGKYINDRYLKVNYTGDGVTAHTADEFLLHHQPDSVCIVRGRQSINSLYPTLRSKCTVSEMIVYDNSPKSNIDIQKTNILVFTSPMNLQAYFDANDIDMSQKVIVIGSTTAMAALEIGLHEIHIARNPSIESLAESTIQLCQTWSDI